MRNSELQWREIVSKSCIPIYVKHLTPQKCAAETHYPKKARRLPEILSQREVTRLIDATRHPSNASCT